MVKSRCGLLLCGMNWLKRKMFRLAAMPWYLLFAHFVSRTMIGIGAGFLMVEYGKLDPKVGGWFNLIVGLAVGLPSTLWAFRNKKGKS